MIMGIDVGTGSCKAVLFSHNGEKLEKSSQDYEIERPEQERAEHDPERLEEALFNAVSKLETDLSQVEAVGATAFGRGFLPLDEDQRPLGNVILSFMDERAEEVEREFPELNWGNSMIFKTLECFRKEEAEIYGSMEYLVDFRDYVGYLLTGELYRNNFGLSDERLAKLSSVDEEDRGYLPESSDFRATRCLTQEVSERTGLDKGTPVSVGLWDAICSAVGSGLAEKGDAMVIAGTTTVVGVITDKGNKNYYGDRALHLGAETAASAEEFLKNLLDIGYKEVNEYASESEAAEGPLVIPFLDGMREFEGVRGDILDLNSGHGKEDLARSAVEAQAYYVRSEIPSTEEINKVYVSGGRAKSRIRNQIRADVLGKPVERLKVDETSALGAAILASVSTSIHQDLDQATREMVETDRKIKPRSEQEKIYEKAFKKYENRLESKVSK